VSFLSLQSIGEFAPAGDVVLSTVDVVSRYVVVWPPVAVLVNPLAGKFPAHTHSRGVLMWQALLVHRSLPWCW
jgi:hypothetical protein